MNAEACRKSFLAHLRDEERSRATLRKYDHDIQLFLRALRLDFEKKAADDFPDLISKEEILLYKEELCRCYAVSSVNSMLVAMNRFLTFIGRRDICVKLLRVQRRAFRNDDRTLSRSDYMKLLRAAKKKDSRLFLLMQTICSTGIRVSEHRFITVESLRHGSAEIHNKGKTRIVPLDRKLCQTLQKYCKRNHIKSGPVFISMNGKPLDRSYIWRKMKKLGEIVAVAAEKIFPHNLRHLFAVTFYQETGDIAHLADLLGHASVDTTRIYTSLSAEDYKNCLCRMKLLLC